MKFKTGEKVSAPFWEIVGEVAEIYTNDERAAAMYSVRYGGGDEDGYVYGSFFEDELEAVK